MNKNNLCVKWTAALGLAATLALPAAAQDNRFIAFGSSASGSSQYVYGGMLAGMAREHLPEVSITNEATSSSTHNLNLLNRGEIQMGMVSPERLHAAYYGLDDYEGENIPVGILWVMNDQATLMFTLADSDINSFRDLEGKRVAIGPAGSSNEVKNAFILEAYGYERTPDTKSDFDDVEIVRLSHTEAASALVDGSIAAAIATQPVPTPAFAELGYNINLKYIGVDEDVFDDVESVYRWFWPTTVSAGRYNGQEDEILTLGDRNYIIGHNENLSEEAAYNLTKAYVEEILPEMAEQVNYLEDYSANTELLTGPWAIPGHPGAVRYYEEKGMEPDVSER